MPLRTDSKKPYILIVDHGGSLCAEAAEFLKSEGFHVDCTYSVPDALVHLKEYSVDIVLLDVDKSDSDGFDVCQQIRADKHGAIVPILTFTQRNDAEAVTQAFEAGATDFTTKPVNRAVLPHRIRNMLRASELLEELSQSHTSLDVAQRIAGLGNWEYVISTGELIWSDNLFRILGVEPHSQTPDLSFYMKHVDEIDRPLLYAWLSNDDESRSASFKHQLITETGEERQVKIQIQSEYDSAGVISRKWGVVHDITEQIQAEQKIHQLAYYDSLTRLPNRALFCERLARDIALAKHDPTDIAVLFLDLDNFKRVNDSLGHAYGDLLLQEVGERLQICALNINQEYESEDVSCTVARMGGDEFTVLLRGIACREEVERFAKTLSESLSQIFVLDENDCHTSTSIGISFYPDHGQCVDELLKTADIAMYGAKKIGKGCFQTYSQKMDENSIRRYRMEELLRTAISNNELILNFQPQMNLQSGELESVEALVRWNSEELGLVPPDDFIPLAEDTGMIVPIGEWVLRTACVQAKEWIEEGVPLKRVAVNISVIEFIRPDFVKMVTKVVEESGLDPSFVELEITESVLVEDTFSAVNTLQELKDIGFLLSIDDFGTGFSSLSQLKHFPIDRLKIDQSFVHGMLTNVHDAAIIKAVLTMASSMNLKVIAEGVETTEQLELLNKIHCDEAQGFLLSRPVPAAGIAELFTEFNSTQPRLTGTGY